MSLRMMRGAFRIPKYLRVKNRCQVCGGHIPKGRHYTCSIGCKIDQSKVN